MTLRDYQHQALDDLDDGWGHNPCQLLRMGTGTGKSKTAANAVREHRGGSLMMAHRGEIVGQLALALAREGVRHRVIGPDALVRLCQRMQIKDMGTHLVDANARAGVASVQSLSALKGESRWLDQVTFLVADEGHHYVRDNAYGKVLAPYDARGARILLPTATPARTDGKGLGRHADGYVDHMVLGPSEAEMMQAGWLCAYRIFRPPNNFHREAIHLGASREMLKAEVQSEVKKSTIFGDSVEHYLMPQFKGQRALQFCDSIENATEVLARFREAGVAAELLTGKTHSDTRMRVIERFAGRQGVDVLISVDLIDEGFDCPAVELVLDTAPTSSLIRFRQRFGRGWRPDGDKVFHYLDFVGNVKQHGLPEAYRKWTLDRRERRGSSAPSEDVEPVKTCANPVCNAYYAGHLAACPYCHTAPVPVSRKGPEFVEGVLEELDEETRAAMLGEVARIDGAMEYGARPHQWLERQRAQKELRGALELWGGWQTAQGRTLAEGERRFYQRYGLARVAAMALGAREARELREHLLTELRDRGIIDATGNTAQ